MEKETYKILVVDDSRHTREVIQRNLADAGYDVYTCGSVADAVAFLRQSTIDLVITDYKMPDAGGHDLIRHVRDNLTDVEVMMITGYPDIEGAVKAIKEGAGEYLVKPFTDEELLTVVGRMIDKIRRRRAVRTAVAPARSFGIIGESPKMQTVFQRIQKAAAAVNATVLISGESGTGKELVARAIHYNSERRNAPFVTVNCAAIPDTLLESELFGHVRGAFTGANENRKGFFQIAEGGTIFLDEIGDASLNMQGKLLRVMQNKEIRMVGSNRVQQVNARIIAATHRDLLNMIKQGLFREDLFYRLNVIDIPLPPLSERGDDILHLTSYFANRYAGEMNRSAPAFSDNVLDAFKNYAWPGNIRELENLIQRLVVVVDGDSIHTADLPESMRFIARPMKHGNRKLDDVIDEHILNVLSSVNGNKTQAAEILGVDRKTLRVRLQKIEGDRQMPRDE